MIAALTFSCDVLDKDKEDDPAPDGISESLHFSFKTPDWSRHIDCTHLDLPSNSLDKQNYYVSATSQSTNNTFFLSFPRDSSAMVNPSNLKRYAIAEYTDNDGPFQFSLKLPVKEGSTARMVSKGGLSEVSYNEITAIKYIGREGSSAVFTIKGKYAMTAYEINNSANEKPVTGTFHFKVKTTNK
ncbi:hypothetical protein [uncultured Pontibacter sp.]|uniref:hypothetical protein n=1 Tax=uncultured Pontibacter sp. TaxID=453356 RepID=UPI00260BC951|nr:hypothetical protein [uncultured Pontibacter sp.]